MKHILFFITLIIALPLSSFAQVSVGENAPDFSLQVLGAASGETVSIAQLEGKVVYIFFYGAACPHCISNGPVTEDEIYQSFVNDTNFVALGLDTWDYSVSANNSFRNQTGITYDLLLQAKQTLVAYYGTSSAYDRSVVIGADGKIRYKGTGYVNSDYQKVITSIETELSKISTSSELGEHLLPSAIQLEQNYPNPFNPSTTITYTLNSAGTVRLQVFNLLGKEVATLVNGFQSSGEQTVSWDASAAPSGVYIYRLTAGDQVLTKRMMLIK